MSENEPYKIDNVKKLTPILKEFLDKFKGQGYTYPELLVAINSALFLLAFEKSRTDFG